MANIKMKLTEIKANPNNPRVIQDGKFDKLVQSIKEFPKMLEIRPIVVNEHNIVLGGNMRLKACKEAGLKEVPVIKASELTEDEQRQFIIKDNVGFGDWDWELLSTEWDNEELEDWGLDVWKQGSDLNELQESELDLDEEFDPVGASKGLQRVVFIFDGPEEAESYLNAQKVEYVKRNMAWQVNLSSNKDL